MHTDMRLLHLAHACVSIILFFCSADSMVRLRVFEVFEVSLRKRPEPNLLLDDDMYLRFTASHVGQKQHTKYNVNTVDLHTRTSTA